VDYEKLGAFYLGRRYDAASRVVTGDITLYDSKDLTTHALCVGMTGSGKTGLGVVLLEEAAIDGIPAIAIDPKGDLGSLLLAFPRLRPEDFRPWVDEAAAATEGRTLDEHARWTASLWRNGLSDFGQDPSRVSRFRDAAEAAIYTPGSDAGLPLSVLRSFAAPPPAVAADAEALRDRIVATVSGVLTLAGIDVDPHRSRESILLAAILESWWRRGHDLDLATLIREVQAPPFDRVGVLDLESFFPSAGRFELAVSLNNLLASPGFAAWMTGDPPDAARLLFTRDGRPRLSIISIAHLSERERMFFVTLLLHEVIAWMRTQTGTASLRAILYMDEIFGYFPPTQNPPSKTPMLTLLKQARAYGLGVVLATQNPVDLDYKGLTNTGTWLVGRLQAERDKARVMEGLEGASAASGASFDRARMERTLAGLTSRVFLLHNVHEDEPALFHTRWTLSYLRGPLTRRHIQTLMRDRLAASGATTTRRAASAEPQGGPAGARGPAPAPMPGAADPAAAPVERPVLPHEIEERFLPAARLASAQATPHYRPALLGVVTVHYVKTSLGADEWKTMAFLAPLDGEGDPWREPWTLDRAPELQEAPEPGARFAPLPAEAAQPKSYVRWREMLKALVYRDHPLRLWQCAGPRLVSRPGEAEGEFRARLRTALHERRDLEVEKLRQRYAPRLALLRDQIRRAGDRVERERAEQRYRQQETAISIGATLLGALFGRKAVGVGTVGRATTAARSAGRIAREKADVARAEENLDALSRRLADLEAELHGALETIRSDVAAEDLELVEILVPPKKSDLSVDRLTLVWTPWSIRAGGELEARFDVGVTPAASRG
jgi:hypothetical protein